MTTYFSFHLPSRLINQDCCIIRHELTDWELIKQLIDESVKLTTLFDELHIKALKELCSIDAQYVSTPNVPELSNGDSLIVAEIHYLAGLTERVITGKATNEKSFVRFIKYSISLFNDDDRQRLEEIELEAIQDNEHF